MFARHTHVDSPGDRFVTGHKFLALEVYQGKSGHLPFYEEPEAFVRALEAFLSTGR